MRSMCRTSRCRSLRRRSGGRCVVSDNPNRVFQYAVIASLALHALLFVAFPDLLDSARRAASIPPQIIARLMAPEPAPPAPAAPAEEVQPPARKKEVKQEVKRPPPVAVVPVPAPTMAAPVVEPAPAPPAPVARPPVAAVEAQPATAPPAAAQ